MHVSWPPEDEMHFEPMHPDEEVGGDDTIPAWHGEPHPADTGCSGRIAGCTPGCAHSMAASRFTPMCLNNIVRSNAAGLYISIDLPSAADAPVLAGMQTTVQPSVSCIASAAVLRHS